MVSDEGGYKTLILYAKISVAEKQIIVGEESQSCTFWSTCFRPEHFLGKHWTILSMLVFGVLFKHGKTYRCTGLWTLCGRLSLSQGERSYWGWPYPRQSSFQNWEQLGRMTGTCLQATDSTRDLWGAGWGREPVLTPCLTVFAAWAAFFFAS